MRLATPSAWAYPWCISQDSPSSVEVESGVERLVSVEEDVALHVEELQRVERDARELGQRGQPPMGLSRQANGDSPVGPCCRIHGNPTLSVTRRLLLTVSVSQPRT
jgi:hypothetical protein